MAENSGKQSDLSVGQSRKERRMLWWSKQQHFLQEEQGDSSASQMSSEKERQKDTSKVQKKTKKRSFESVDALSPSETKKKKGGATNKFYVLFVGQIPYDASTDDITKHFSQAGAVKSVRLITHKDSGKSKGFGYVEFANSKSYLNGLNLHHSKINGRPINVEITSPGRGTSLFRKENLKRKNAEMARFRGIKEDGASGGALCIPKQNPRQFQNKNPNKTVSEQNPKQFQNKKNKKKRFDDDT